MDHPEISETAVHFSPFIMPLVTCRVPSVFPKSRTQPLTFFSFFRLSQIFSLASPFEIVQVMADKFH